MKYIANIILIVFTVYSCSSVKVNSSGIFSGAGNKWTYIYDNESKPHTLIVEVLKHETGQLILSDFPYLCLNSESRVLYYTDGSHIVNNIKFYPPYNNIKKDHMWESGGYNFSIVNTNENIIIGDKLYSDCIHISFSNSITYAGEMWIKDGVGIVKWSFIRTNPPSTEVGYYLLNE